jgi:hypothetical protein
LRIKPLEKMFGGNSRVFSKGSGIAIFILILLGFGRRDENLLGLVGAGKVLWKIALINIHSAFVLQSDSVTGTHSEIGKKAICFYIMQ